MHCIDSKYDNKSRQIEMNLKIASATLLCISTLTACSTTPPPPVVLEQHKNISAEPPTKHNLARLIQQKDNCVIEFTGNFETGKATEHWIFKGDQLISAFSNVDAEVENKQTVFDPKDAEKLKNFNSLKNNFKTSNLEKCN